MAQWDDTAIDWYAENFGEDISNQWVMDVAAIAAGEDVLDIGCGTGAALRLVESHAGRLVGVDPFARMIDHAKAATASGSKIEFFVAAGEALPFGDDRFDVVTLINVVHHLENADKGLAEAARVLRPLGRLVIGGEVFGESALPDGQAYDAPLAALGFGDIRTTVVADGDGFVTIATKGKRDV